jgi:hypothetical protein
MTPEQGSGGGRRAATTEAPRDLSDREAVRPAIVLKHLPERRTDPRTSGKATHDGRTAWRWSSTDSTSEALPQLCTSG